MKTQLYQIKPGFARHNQLPTYFAGVALKETARAVYLYGKGTTETRRMGQCYVCGRKLTHPVSVELGIGPECGKHYWDWDLVGGYSKENLARLTQVIRDHVHIDAWVPKSTIVSAEEAQESVTVPTDHPMLQPPKPTASAKKASQITFQQSGALGIKIEFPFDREMVEAVKTIPGRRFNGDARPKYWTAPLSVEAVEKLQALGFDMDDSLLQYLKKSQINVQDMSTDVEVPGLRGKLFPFQQQGVAFLEARDGRALIADEMGLGKTVQALAWLQRHPGKRPAIIVVPASLKLNWEREANRWMTDPKTQVLQGTNPSTPIIGELLIINYDILPHWVEALKAAKPQVVIMDEAHYIKSNKTKRTKAVRTLAKGVPHVIALTGTPIVNRPVEMLNPLRLIDRTVVPDPWAYLKRYCGAKHNGFGWDFNGATNTEELHQKLSNTVMIRRKKADVLKELPDKVRSFIPMELSNAKVYRNAETNFINFVREQKGAAAAAKASNAAALAEIEGLKQIAVQGKLDRCVEWIRDFIEVDGKLVVFAVHRFVIDRLMEEFGPAAVRVDGSVTGPARDHAVRDFQSEPGIRLFVGNIKAAGVGLTLTASSNVAFLELPWTPGDLTQAEDRVHRIGQKDSVNIHYLLADGTIEEDIARLIDRKRRVLDKVLDGEETNQDSLLSELMNQYETPEE